MADDHRDQLRRVVILTLAVLSLRGAVAVLLVAMLAGGIPAVIRGALAVSVGVWTALLVTTGAAAPPLDASSLGITALVAIAAREVAIGAAIGLLAAVPLLAAAAAGAFVDQTARARRGPYAPLFGVLAAAVFVGVDGHVAAMTAIVDSFHTAPAFGSPRDGVVAAIVALVPAAARLAAPWLVTAVVVEIAAGAGARVAARSGAHAPLGAAVPAALAMMTASLVGVFAIAVAHLVRSA